MASSDQIYRFTGQLFHQLKSRGFRLKIEDFNDAMLLMPEFDGDYEAFKFRLAALICISPAEQQDLYVIYDEVLQKNRLSAEQNARKAGISRLWKWMAFFAGIVVFGILIFKLVDKEDTSIVPVDYSATAEVMQWQDIHEPLSHNFNLDRFLGNNKHIDKKKLSVLWTIDDSVKSTAIAFSHDFTDLKRHYYRVALKAPEYKIDTFFKGNFLSRPKLHFLVNSSEASGEIGLGDSIQLEMHTNNAFRDSAYIYLKTAANKDSVVAIGKAAAFTQFVPKKIGSYTFTGHVRKKFDRQEEDTASHAWSKPTTIKVVAVPTLSVAVDADNQPPVAKKMKTALVIGTALLVALLFWTICFYAIRKHLLEKKIKNTDTDEKNKAITEQIKTGFQGRSLPVDVEWKDKNRLIHKDSFLDNWNKGLVQNIQTDRYEINIPATISKTANNIGIITPIRQQKIKQKRYVILVSRKNRRDAQFRLFDYLVQNLYHHNLPIDYYSYSDNFTITDCNNEVVSFADITNYSRQNSLMIFGDGHLFINFRTNKVDAEFADKLSEWQNKIVITPVPYSDWSAEEKILQQEIAMVPADIRGLLDIVKILNDETGFYNYDRYTSAHLDFRNLQEVSNYLNDAELFQWLCALAIYPKIYWELIIAMGDALFPEKVNYPNLLKLARITWVSEAAFPVDIRLALLKSLSPEYEIKARALLLSLINDDLAGMTESSFSYEEKQVQKFTNSFMLASTGQPQYTSPAITEDAEQFIALYKTGNINDNAFKLYIDNPDNAWQTPIVGNQCAKDYIDTYEKDDTVKEAKQAVRKSYWKFMLLTIPATLLAALVCWPIAGIISSRTTWLDPFFTTELQQATFDFTLTPASCWSSKDNLQWTIYKDSDSIHKINRKGSRASIAVDSMEANTAYNVAVTNGNAKFFGFFVPQPNENYEVSLRCAPPKPLPAITYTDTVNIQYESGQPAVITQMVKNLQLAHHYVKATVQVPSTKGNYIEYYKTGQLKTARDIQTIIGGDFTIAQSKIVLPEKMTGNIMISVKAAKLKAVPVSIQYYPAEARQKAELFRIKMNREGKFYCKEVDFEYPNSKSQVRYFADKDYSDAKELASLAGKDFNQELKAVQVKWNNKAAIELWITTASHKIRILTNKQLTNNLKVVQANIRDKILKISAGSNYNATVSLAETDKLYHYGVTYYDPADAALAKQLSSGLGSISYKDMNGNGHSEVLTPLLSENKTRKGDIDIYVRADDAPCKSFKSGNMYTIFFDYNNKMVEGSELLLGKSGAIRVMKDNTQIFTEIVTYTKDKDDGKGTARGAAMALEVTNFLYSMGMDLKNVKTVHKYDNTSDSCTERVEVTITYQK